MKADFYVGLGVDAEWLGSIESGGMPHQLPLSQDLVNHSGDIADFTEDDYRNAVTNIIKHAQADEDNRGVRGDDPWPWSHNTSAETDYAYAWNNGCVHVFEEGYMVAQHYPNGARRRSEFPPMIRKHSTNPVAGRT